MAQERIFPTVQEFVREQKDGTKGKKEVRKGTILLSANRALDSGGKGAKNRRLNKGYPQRKKKKKAFERDRSPFYASQSSNP